MTDALMAEATRRMWIAELDARTDGRPDWSKRRIAARKVCDGEVPGLSSALAAVTQGGELTIPPAWPEVDAVCVGGGAGFLTVAVRTLYQMSKREVMVRIPRLAPGQNIAAAAESLERGRFELRRLLS